MATAYDLDDIVKVDVSIVDAAGAPATPTEIRFILLRPNGSFVVRALTDLDSEITSEGVGLYKTSFKAAYSGQHDYRWEIDGPGEGAHEGSFWVSLNRLKDQAP